jgi:hypothetical protein
MRTTREVRRGERAPAPRPFQARLPGFVADEPVGLGDAISRVTRAVGLRPCDGCRRRAAALNRWLVFTGRAK